MSISCARFVDHIHDFIRGTYHVTKALGSSHNRASSSGTVVRLWQRKESDIRTRIVTGDELIPQACPEILKYSASTNLSRKITQLPGSTTASVSLPVGFYKGARIAPPYLTFCDGVEGHDSKTWRILFDEDRLKKSFRD